jgi:ATPase subunit of ABC transporter with duplicated ATPase domains
LARFRITVTNQPASDPLPRIHGIASKPIGRTQEIALLPDRLRFRPDRIPIYVITGPPGVGKSTLAHFVANTLAVEDYPDGQLTMQLSQQAGEQVLPLRPPSERMRRHHHQPARAPGAGT